MAKTLPPTRTKAGCLVAIAVAVQLGSMVRVSAETIRVATLNCEFLNLRKVHIKFGLPFDLRDPQRAQWEQPGFRDARFLEASKAVASVIHRLDADVLALTEVGDDADVETLRQEVAALGLVYPHTAVGDSADRNTGQHVAVFSKRPLETIARTIPGREFYDVELDDPETEAHTGISKGMSVVFRVDGKPVHLYVVHLASERGGHEQDAQRIAQASIVRRTYLDALNRGDHVIVAGDLNDRRGEPTLRRIRGRDDIHGDLIQTGRAEFFPDDKLDTRWTLEFRGRRDQLDHILISQSVRDACKRGGVDAEVAPITESIAATTHPATDHRAFVLTLDFR